MQRCLASNAIEVPKLGNNPFFSGCLPYRSTIASTAPDSSLSFSRWFAGEFGGDFLETPVNPDATFVSNAGSCVPDGVTSIVFCSYNGHLNKGQMELARVFFEIARQRGISFACLALRNPWDLFLLPEGAYGLAIWEYTTKSFEAAAAVFRGEFVPGGQLPKIEGGLYA